MADFVQTLITTLEVGSLYALIALGYTMVYGILKFINFAHSDIVVLGAWISYTLASKILPRVGTRSAQPGSAAAALGRRLSFWSRRWPVCGLVGFAIERLAYRPLRQAPRLNVLITAIGVSLLAAERRPVGFRVRPQPAEDAGAAAELELVRLSFASSGGEPR